MHDVAVVGLGPAGRSLVSRCATLGLKVLAIDPRPDAAWHSTYGLWDDELDDLPESVVASRVKSPVVWAREHHSLGRAYVILDNPALQEALSLDGATIRQQRLDDTGMLALRAEATIVVDARGARPDGGLAHDQAPAQTAYGIVVGHDDSTAAMQGADGILMDWRTDWAADSETATGQATFLYAMPIGSGEVLLEETCLAASPPLSIDELKVRLRQRLIARGLDPHLVDEPRRREIVRIPLHGRDTPPLPGVLAMGTAGRGGHLVSGYSIAHSLRRGAQLAREISEGRGVGSVVDPWRPADAFREAGLRALLRLDVADTIALFDAFGRLSPASQRDFLSRDSTASAVSAAMWRMFKRMPMSAKAGLAAATFGPGGPRALPMDP